MRGGGKSFGGYKRQDVAEFTEHADEVKEVQRGRDIVEAKNPERESRPAPFDRKELQVVRSWARGRPLEPTSPAATMIPYPRMWSSKRGRYSKFKLPGAGSYGLVRARPTF
jgi:hypothetical protein